MKIRVFAETDRLTVAAILVKNGYRVSQSKERKTPTGKSYNFYIEADEPTSASPSGEEAK